jgi:phage portal protein BeeE
LLSLEHENRRFVAANEILKRDIGEVFDCCPKVNKDLTDLERAKLEEEMTTFARHLLRRSCLKADSSVTAIRAAIAPAPTDAKQAILANKKCFAAASDKP